VGRALETGRHLTEKPVFMEKIKLLSTDIVKGVVMGEGGPMIPEENI